MAIITLPTGIKFAAGSGAGQRTYGMSTSSDATGAGQDRTFGPSRWTLRLVSPEEMLPTEAALWESVVIRLRGRINHLAAHDPGKVAPLGTRRGTLTLTAAAAAGATSISVSGTGTLVAGDWLQIGTGLGTSQLVKVAVDTSTAAVTIEPPLRTAFAINAAVTWDKPLGYYKLASQVGQWTYGAGTLQGGFALDLVEQWA
jgi:hypothetical protein